ncbi:hypothetical protein BGZ52_004111 [Haplosporangium bisporale]|nr:hypothetical protein BGZ52_004111 [Haplosporangium bisporale]KAF9215229.1 hypothetical protein BGZ59_001924 [Podila verticillata]
MAEPFDGSTSHARRPLHQDNDNPHAHDQHQDQYPNPFQQPPGQHTSSQQQHYSILIPTVNHWPRIALEGLARGAVHALDALKYAQRTLHAHVNQHRANSSSSYHVLPTSSADLHELSSPSSSPPHRRRIITFGSKRQQKESGYRVLCSSRRWTRLFAALTLLVLLITLLVLPRRMNPFRSRVVWVRYYSHEEPVKIVLPFGRQVYVSDVKATAMKAMAFGNLNCFTTSYYPSNNIRFKPENDEWYSLYHILNAINADTTYWHTFNRLSQFDIMYLRKGFDDPRANELIRDMSQFNSKQRNHNRMGYDHPHYAPSTTIPMEWSIPSISPGPDLTEEEFDSTTHK